MSSRTREPGQPTDVFVDPQTNEVYITDGGTVKLTKRGVVGQFASYVERQNLTMRMSMRRFTRLTNAFSKKVENHAAAAALYFMYYNFARIHQTLRTTPAQAAGVTEKLWGIEDIVSLLG